MRELGEILGELAMAEGTRRSKLWESARFLLAPYAKQNERIAKVLSLRSFDGLSRLLRELHAAAKVAPQQPPIDQSVQAAPAPPPSAAPASPPEQPPTPEQLKSAMKMFRKRLKLTRLDDESRLGRSGNPMTGGRHSQVMAIMPPREFSKAVWDELVRQGKLRTKDGAFYELAEQ